MECHKAGGLSAALYSAAFGYRGSVCAAILTIALAPQLQPSHPIPSLCFGFGDDDNFSFESLTPVLLCGPLLAMQRL